MFLIEIAIEPFTNSRPRKWAAVVIFKKSIYNIL